MEYLKKRIYCIYQYVILHMFRILIGQIMSMIHVPIKNLKEGF